ncbi:MAG: hypothetical protein ABIQ18_18040 [Umezawaea sp.]
MTVEIRWLRSRYSVVWHAYPVYALDDSGFDSLQALCGHTESRADLLAERPTAIWLVCVTDVGLIDAFRRPAR